MKLTHKKFLITSLPFTAASVSVPLIGAVDTAIAGGLGSYHYINSVALGSVIFSTIFWLFNFLGLTASGFASQSLGSGNKQEELCAFLRGSILACGIGLVIILLQNHIFNAAVQFFNPPAETLVFMRLYFNIIVYTVPAALFYQTAQGWLAGIMQVRFSVAVGLTANIANALLAFILVYGCGLGVAGVAAASALANILAAVLALYGFYKSRPCSLKSVSPAQLFSGQDFAKLLNCSGHLAIRTLCMLIMINTFMSQSSAFGGEILAANSILMQIQYVMGDVFTGFSQAAAIYAGIAAGEGNKKLLQSTLKISAIQSLAAAFLQTGLYFVWRAKIAGLFTGLPQILAAVNRYDMFIVFFPILSALGIVYYGVFNGTLQTTPICISMLKLPACQSRACAGIRQQRTVAGLSGILHCPQRFFINICAFAAEKISLPHIKKPSLSAKAGKEGYFMPVFQTRPGKKMSVSYTSGLPRWREGTKLPWQSLPPLISMPSARQCVKRSCVSSSLCPEW
jgi:MATE family multidrug resistance protein